jgi:hypothetical protein
MDINNSSPRGRHNRPFKPVDRPAVYTFTCQITKKILRFNVAVIDAMPIEKINALSNLAHPLEQTLQIAIWPGPLILGVLFGSNFGQRPVS